MAEIVNLRQARKAKRRREDAAGAQANRLLHGRSKSQRQAQETERARQERQLEGSRRDTSGEGET
ncbi:DUF4169 family protein [Novosphingobium aquimarinum]|uniref:DUF4169 family protein n=1 Tax=Novosphingobium aquimarinum TaxID=2682494 RepID=UPI0012EC042A|nr:DUF4169 family protein [Novosphingobium aquimarinum]